MLRRLYTDESYFKEIFKVSGVGSRVCTNHPEFYEVKSKDQVKSNQDKKVLNENNESIRYSNTFKNLPYFNKTTELLFFSHFSCFSNELLSEPRIVNYPFVISYHEDNEEIDLICCEKFSNFYSRGNTKMRLPNTNFTWDVPYGIRIDSLEWNIKTPHINQENEDGEESGFKLPGKASCCNLNESQILVFGGTRNGVPVNELILLTIKESERMLEVTLLSESLEQISPRAQAGMCVHNSKLYIHGGSSNGTILNDFYEVEILKKFSFSDLSLSNVVFKITRVLDFGSPGKCNHYLVECRNKIYCVGGTSQRKQEKPYCFDLDLMAWKAVEFKGCRYEESFIRKNFGSSAAVKGPLIIVPITRFSDPRERSWFIENLCKYKTEKVPKFWVLDVENQISSYMFGDYLNYGGGQHFIYEAPGNYFVYKINEHPRIHENNDFHHMRVEYGNLYKCELPPFSGERLHLVLKEAYDLSELGDLDIVCQDGVLKANKLFLAARVNESLKLMNSVENNTVVLKYQTEVVDLALRYLYYEEFNLKAKDTELLEKLSQFASEYELTGLYNYCVLSFESDIKPSKGNLYNDYINLHGVLQKNKLSFLETELLEKTLGPDLCLKAGQKSFKCHKILVLLRSNYIRKILEYQPNTSEILLEHITPNALAHALNYIYSDLVQVELQQMGEVLFAARFLEIDSLFLDLQRQMSLKMSPGTVPVFLEQAYSLNAANLIKFCLEFIQVNWRQISKTAEFEWILESNPELAQEINHHIELGRESQKRPPFEKIDQEVIDAMPAGRRDQKVTDHLSIFPRPELSDPLPLGCAEPKIDNSSLLNLRKRIQETNLTELFKSQPETPSIEETQTFKSFNSFGILDEL